MAQKDYVRGMVWTIPFKFEDIYTGARQAQPAGGRHRQRRSEVQIGGAKERRAIVLAASPDRRMVRVVLCRTAYEEERKRLEQDNTVVLFEADDAGGWTSELTAVDCANPRSLSNVPFHAAVARPHEQISEAKMREIDKAVVRGLKLGQYGDFQS